MMGECRNCGIELFDMQYCSDEEACEERAQVLEDEFHGCVSCIKEKQQCRACYDDYVAERRAEFREEMREACYDD